MRYITGYYWNWWYAFWNNSFRNWALRITFYQPGNARIKRQTLITLCIFHMASLKVSVCLRQDGYLQLHRANHKRYPLAYDLLHHSRSPKWKYKSQRYVLDLQTHRNYDPTAIYKTLHFPIRSYHWAPLE